MSISCDYYNGLITGTRISKFGDSFKYNEYGEVTGYSADYYYSTFYRANYTRDNAGRITSSTETLKGVSTVYDYKYDTVGRIVSSVIASPKGVADSRLYGRAISSYTYDSNGNRLSKSSTLVGEDLGEGRITCDSEDRLLTYGNKTYTYSANGELSSKSSFPQGVSGNPEVTKYDYDEFGNLRKLTLSDGRTIEYIIDAQNRRIGKKTNGTLVKGWLYGSCQEIGCKLA